MERVILVTVEEVLAAAAYPAYLSQQTILLRAKRLAEARGLDLHRHYTVTKPRSWLHGVVEFRQEVA